MVQLDIRDIETYKINETCETKKRKMSSDAGNRRMSMQVTTQTTPVQRDRPKHSSAPSSALRRSNTSTGLGERKSSHSSSAASSANENRRRSASRSRTVVLSIIIIPQWGSCPFNSRIKCWGNLLDLRNFVCCKTWLSIYCIVV